MTKYDILRLAREAGLAVVLEEHASEYGNGTFENTSYPELERFAALVAAHKAEVITAEAYRGGYKDGMEAAVVVCENVAGMYQHAHNASSENIADECAAAIRARGTT
jgi:hypothetical protein